jgi:hypothetical protein
MIGISSTCVKPISFTYCASCGARSRYESNSFGLSGERRQEPRWSSYTEQGAPRALRWCRLFIHSASFHWYAKSQTTDPVRGAGSARNANGSDLSTLKSPPFETTWYL